MKIIKTIPEMKAAVGEHKSAGRTIGLVPTMGFLHEGHFSLVRAARKKADVTVVSIFVNPAQFGPKEDLKTYPRDLNRDSVMLEKEGVDYVFHPEAGEMYPHGYKTYVEVRDLQEKLCGRSRPEHFRGVCTVVLKLFQIVGPDIAFFGQKDAQQAIILRKMAQDLNLDVQVEIMPIVREADGLAMSSRNTYLSPEERAAALVLAKSLEAAKRQIDHGERRAGVILGGMKAMIGEEPLARIDYVEAVDMEDLDPVKKIVKGTLIALAVFIGPTRLIDNMIVSLER
ncbi:MAG: pantoate--beta-alanine ligase [Candidatus Aminicenantes bacterium]|nr:pantoate--beta-alanine ligase [Candidatus Aminicenantes bacterium]